MITNISITNFRGVREAKIEGLKPLTILIGKNNSGKSTLLEGLWLASADPMEVLPTIARRRGWYGLPSIGGLFLDPGDPRFHVASNLSDANVLRGLGLERGAARDLGFDVEAVPTFQVGATSSAFGQSSRFVTEKGQWSNVHRTSEPHSRMTPTTRFIDLGTISELGAIEDAYSNAFGGGNEKALDDLVAHLGLPDRRLRLLKWNERVMLSMTSTQPGVLGMPIYLLGDGFKRLIFMACQVASQAAGGHVLMEEPEAFQHPRYLEEFAALVWRGIDLGVQIVLTTHSDDLLRTLLLDQKADLLKAVVLRTGIVDQVLRAVPIEGSRAAERLDGMGEDLR